MAESSRNSLNSGVSYGVASAEKATSEALLNTGTQEEQVDVCEAQQRIA